MKQMQLLSVSIVMGICASLCPLQIYAEEEPAEGQEAETEIIVEEEQQEPETAEDAPEEVLVKEENAEPEEIEETGAAVDIDIHAPKVEGMIPYLDEYGNTQYADGDMLAYVPDVENGVIEEGWYLASGSYQFSNRLTISGDVHIILADDCSYEMKNGIHHYRDSHANLIIYAQSNGDHMGKLTCQGGEYQAGIGGNDNEAGGAVYLIGGEDGDSGFINIWGGRVTARGTQGGAGIGGG